MSETSKAIRTILRFLGTILSSFVETGRKYVKEIDNLYAQFIMNNENAMRKLVDLTCGIPKGRRTNQEE